MFDSCNETFGSLKDLDQPTLQVSKSPLHAASQHTRNTCNPVLAYCRDKGVKAVEDQGEQQEGLSCCWYTNPWCPNLLFHL